MSGRKKATIKEKITCFRAYTKWLSEGNPCPDCEASRKAAREHGGHAYCDYHLEMYFPGAKAAEL